ncbi:hypothetical protein DFH07DRAFT_39563 [Mycena maculata]|uniref:Uncharacterized protein n=1 Tax=Mycena maculata TaxID=230809 RepID=A0AAD7IGT0_9AGAR|nr:hypothetical protein DFH07DRAFT_39563 [Mycena maculata]
MVRRSFLPLAYLFGQLRDCFATISNRTIDDTNGDPITGFTPVYAPEAQWNVGQNCSGCLVQPDPSQVFDRTWHDTTQGTGGVPSSVTLNFTGTAIYLFCVVPNTISFATTVYDLSFTLDDGSIGTYTHVPDASDEILYSVPVLSSENLSNQAHTLVAETAGNSLFVFDFAIYTFDDSPPTTTTSMTATSSAVPIGAPQTSTMPGSTQSTTSRSRAPLAAIVAGSIAGVVAIILSLLAIRCWKRRRRQGQRRDDESTGGNILRDQVPSAVMQAQPHSFESGPGASSRMVQVGSASLPFASSIYSPEESTVLLAQPRSVGSGPGPSSLTAQVDSAASFVFRSSISSPTESSLPPYAPTDPYRSPDSVEPTASRSKTTKIRYITSNPQELGP